MLPLSVLRDIEVCLDADVTRVPTLQSSTPSFVSLPQISNVRRSLTQDALLTIIRAPVTMKLELLLLCTGWFVYIANATAIVCVEHH